MEFKRKGREKEYYKEWYELNKTKKAKGVKEWYNKTKKVRLKKRKEYYNKNKKKEIEAAHNWQKTHREQYNAWARKWAKTHREKINEYYRNKKKNNIEFKLKNDLRKRIHTSLKKNYKESSCIKYLGCTIPELKTYLEKQFKPEMTWRNHTLNGWHIDHIKPICDFDFTKEEEIKKALHYTNLQPLWCKENWKKNRY